MKLYDCFPLLDELDMLKDHLRALENVVDTFVVTESTTTFSGKPKQAVFKIFQNDQEFKDWNILRVEVGLYSKDPWLNEKRQRDACIPYLKLEDDDVVIVADVDEIPNPEAIKGALPLSEPHTLMMDHYQGSYKCKLNNLWPGPVLVPGKLIKQKNSLDIFRMARWNFPQILNGGSHLSWFGGVDQIIAKVESFSHVELNCPEFKDRPSLQESLDKGIKLIPWDE